MRQCETGTIRKNSAPCFSTIFFACLAALTISSALSPYNTENTDICHREFYSYRIELHLPIVFFCICVSLKKMNLFDHRLATILQIRTVLAARMFELRELRRRVQIAQLSPRRRRRARSKTALFKSLDAESIGRPQRVGLAKWRARCGRRLRPRLK